MTDEDLSPEAEDEAPKRRGRPPKAEPKEEPETADTFMVHVRMTKAETQKDGSKTKKGQIYEMPLSLARHKVAKDIAQWSDPRPDLK